MEKFVERHKCIHSRLTFFVPAPPSDRIPFCTESHLKDNLGSPADDDPGIGFIKVTMNGFLADQDSNSRCGCKEPCQRLRISAHTWKTSAANETDESVFAFIQFDDLFKTYTYSLLYTNSEFLADIGGYLGLFLGLSLYGLIDIVQLMIELYKKTFRTKDTNAQPTHVRSF